MATSAAFGPWLGTLYSGVGAFASALLMYGVGVHFGRGPLGRILGPRWRSALDGARGRGVLAVVALRWFSVWGFWSAMDYSIWGFLPVPLD